MDYDNHRKWIVSPHEKVYQAVMMDRIFRAPIGEREAVSTAIEIAEDFNLSFFMETDTAQKEYVLTFYKTEERLPERVKFINKVRSTAYKGVARQRSPDGNSLAIIKNGYTLRGVDDQTIVEALSYLASHGYVEKILSKHKQSGEPIYRYKTLKPYK